MKNIFVAALLLLAVSCQKDEAPEVGKAPVVDYFIFGNFYGECSGNCAVFYKYVPQSDQVFVDEMTYFSFEATEDIPFGTAPLSDNKSGIAQGLLEQITSKLPDVDNGTLGCPDCADQGGAYIAVKKDGELRYWIIDPSLDIYDVLLQDVRTAMQQMAL